VCLSRAFAKISINGRFSKSDTVNRNVTRMISRPMDIILHTKIKNVWRLGPFIIFYVNRQGYINVLYRFLQNWGGEFSPLVRTVNVLKTCYPFLGTCNYWFDGTMGFVSDDYIDTKFIKVSIIISPIRILFLPFPFDFPKIAGLCFRRCTRSQYKRV
jgi:hypothetical protein